MTFGKTPTSVNGKVGNKTVSKRKKLAAVSAVLGMIIGIGVTSAVGGGVYYAFQEQADLFSSSSQVEIRNLNAVRSDSTLTLTGNIKNVGSTSISGIEINSISTGENFIVEDVAGCKDDSGNTVNCLNVKIGTVHTYFYGPNKDTTTTIDTSNSGTASIGL